MTVEERREVIDMVNDRYRELGKLLSDVDIDVSYLTHYDAREQLVTGLNSVIDGLTTVGKAAMMLVDDIADIEV